MEKQEMAATVTLVLIVVAVAAAASQKRAETVKVRFSTTNGNSSELSLEVADTPGERKTGLMNRKSLEKHHGMLFIFPEERKRVFWMKDTYIPLDIIFVDAEMKVVDIDRAEPEPDTPDSELKRYRSGSPVKYVVEVRKGFTQREGVEPGYRLLLTG